jgi:hypothetical protein
MARSADNRFVLSVIKAFLKRNQGDSVAKALDHPLHWPRICSLATHQNLLPLIHHVLSQNNQLETIPLEVRNLLDEGLEQRAAICLLYENLLGRLLRAFDHLRVPFILFKGPAMALEFYRPREVRPYADLDILIKAEDFEQVKRCLSHLGLEVADPATETIRRRYFNSVVFSAPSGPRIEVDLHWDTLMISWNRRPFLSSRATWSHKRTIEFNGMNLPVLPPHVLIPYLCVHISFHHQFGRLLSFCDLDLAVQKWGGDNLWEGMVRQCLDQKIRKPVFCTLKLARTLLGTPVPEAVLQALRPGGLVGPLLPVNYLLFRDAPIPKTLERLIKFILIEGLGGKVRSLAAFCGQARAANGG